MAKRPVLPAFGQCSTNCSRILFAHDPAIPDFESAAAFAVLTK